MRAHAVAVLALLTACSSHGSSTSLGVPSPLATGTPTVPASGVPSRTPGSASVPPTRTTAAASSSPSPSLHPARTSGASPAGSPSRRSAPRATASGPAGATVAVSQVTGDRFAPSSLALHVGDSVLVTDRDAVAPHTFTIAALHVDSGGMSAGQTFRYRFTSPGRFGFVCTYHQDIGMTGTVTVR